MSQLVASPAVGFDQPFEMLAACHERVDRTLSLLKRLVAHIDQQGHDAAARSAANDVMRYFDLAAPQHHLDEERHVFPAVVAQGDPACIAAVDALLLDHAQLHLQWAELRKELNAWAQIDPTPGPVSKTMRQAVATFCDRYAQHNVLEDDLVYPAARLCIQSVQALQIMGDEMRARRQR